MKKRKLGSLEVPAIGFGCMVLPGFYLAGSEEQAIATLRRAADIGVNFLDTADAYGNGKNEELVGRAIKGRRGEFLIATNCRALGMGYVAYSPLGRGIFGGEISGAASLAENDRRKAHPRFQGENLAANVTLAQAVAALARAKRCSAAQLALAWLPAKGEDIVPIPGTRRVDHLEENAAAADVALTASEIAALEAACPPGAALGTRYPAAQMSKLNG
jgi:aryl-alcohol dehydrogenase-like predicted oxidoreductase